jgi:cilia- and flagella-associated protein 57
MLAATNGNNVEVISTTTFETVCSLKGHRGRVTAIEWFENDYYIATSGGGGMVCYWEVLTGKPMGENVNKNIGYNGIALSKEKMVYFAIGSDNKLRKFEGSQVKLLIGQTKAGCVCVYSYFSNDFR